MEDNNKFTDYSDNPTSGENTPAEPVSDAEIQGDGFVVSGTASEEPTAETAESTSSVSEEASAESSEYHYVKPESTNLYQDAEYVPSDAADPPRYYVPPEKKTKEKKSSSGSKTGLKVACLCLACALIGGITGGVIGGKSASHKVDVESSSGSSTTQSSSTVSTVAATQTGTMTANEIYQQATEQVVGIQSTISYMNFFGQTSQAAVSGTGFFISNDGYILTNYHVIEEPYESGSTINVLTYDGTTYEATVVGVAPDNDLAVIKIDATDTNAVTFGDSSQMSVGDTVYAVGNPMGELEFTMTSGMVSALDREVTTSEYTSSINMFQFDAAINSGNSGGPVYNANGEVIGVATAKYSSSASSSGVEGLGFAIPSNDASKIANDLMTNGYVTGKAYMGVSIERNYSSTVSQYYDMPEGAYIKYVESGSAAEKAGIQAGDVITQLGDKTVTNYSDLSSAVNDFSAGDTTTVTVYRSGETLTLDITFDEASAQTTNSSTSQQSQDSGTFGFGFGNSQDNASGSLFG